MSKTNNLTDFLTDLANGIRTAEGSTGAINPQDFRTRIENLASGSAKPILYGTYILASNPSFTVPTATVRQDLYGLEAYAWFYNVPEDYWQWLPIYSISYFTIGTCGISSNEVQDISIDYTRSGGWKANYGDYYDFPSSDERWRIIDFCQPVEVSQGFYDLFMQMVDCSDITAYDIGHTIGHTIGQSEALEALGALCDWMITTDAYSNPMITILNHHPNYYLHCEIYDGVGNSWYDFEDGSVVEDEAVIPPNSSKTFYGEDSLSNIKPVNIDNVWWSANA